MATFDHSRHPKSVKTDAEYLSHSPTRRDMIQPHFETSQNDLSLPLNSGGVNCSELHGLKITNCNEGVVKLR